MENEGIQRLLRAEEEAASVISKARENRSIRLKQAQKEAETSANELRKQLEREFQLELKNTNVDDDSFNQTLSSQTNKENDEIERGYKKNSNIVIDLLLYHVTTVKLDISEALRQSLLTKADQGTH